MIRSLRAQAIIATLNGLDAVSKRLNISLKTGLQPRTADNGARPMETASPDVGVPSFDESLD
ncbi:MAG: hypothetical protein Q4D38_07870, partial [Planctomycetia bacterium]|nr:hypothetical protein [Planctomycetia bacterium]